MSEALSGIQFKHEHWSRVSKGSHYSGLQVTARADKYGVVGRMDLNPDPDNSGHREIHDINVENFARHQGIATGMFDHAQKMGLKPRHSSYRTVDGDAWSAKVGTHRPPVDQAP